MAYINGNEILFSSNINITESKTQEKTVEITSNGTTEITPDEGYALSKVTANVNVASENKLPQFIDGTVTKITAEDLAGATKIRDYACYYHTFSQITLPNTIEEIGEKAFYGCGNLKSVTINNGSIGSSVFECCNNLKSVTIGNGVTSIGKKAFAYVSLSGSLIIPESVTNIGDLAFRNNALTSLILNGGGAIGKEAFGSSSYLNTLTIGNKVTVLGSMAFHTCGNLKSVTIGNGVTSINSAAFMYCNRLTDIYIDAEEDSISGAPWGAENATVHWNTPLPTEET